MSLYLKTNEAPSMNQLLKKFLKNDQSQFNLIEKGNRIKTFYTKLTNLSLN